MKNGDFMDKETLSSKVDYLMNCLGTDGEIVVKTFITGKEKPVQAAVIYTNGLADKNMIDRDILNPLMLMVNEKLSTDSQLAAYLANRYIVISNIQIVNTPGECISEIKKGNTAVILEGVDQCIICNTASGEYRSISEPQNEVSARGAREGFVENIQTNLSIIRRRIKDKNLTIEKYVLGRRSQTDIALVYIKDIMDEDILNDIKQKIGCIDIDILSATGTLEQCIENHPYSVFPQSFNTERPDIIEASLMEGRLAILINGTPYVMTIPAIFPEFFQAVEDYYQRTLVANFSRILRAIAIWTVITLPSVYLTLIRFNAELIPERFLIPVVNSRIGIALSPFLEILSMEIIVEFLREGGLRLPNKIAQTLSVVGGVVIGDAAVKAQIVSPATIIVVTGSVLATFLIPNYDMAISIRLLRFPMLIMANYLGALGIAIGWYFIIFHLLSMDSYGVPYFEIAKSSDFKDMLIRAPIWQMNKRPESILSKDRIRQSDFRKKFRSGGSEKGKGK